MSRIIADLFAEIQVDPWRKKNGFSNELEDANKALQEAENDEHIIQILSNWLQKFQPCLFGRLAAKLNLLSFCILTEEDLNNDDEFIQNKIQAARTSWTRDGFNGKKSGFILFVLSKTITYSLPSEKLLSLAKQLCTSYLLEEVEQDKIYTDEIWLEKPGRSQTTWKWRAGVNYFCSNADNRWWQDHRIPGGLAFSVNSVGHMAKACSIATIMNELNKMLGITEEFYVESKVDSLDQALEFAMRTISLASNSISGKATELIDTDETNSKQTCPIALPKLLAGKDCSQYKGYYHTDITIPSEYFETTVERPVDCNVYKLDFTYLYDSNVKNPDFITMGRGRQVRSSNTKFNYAANPKTPKSFPVEEEISANQRLTKAIKQE